MVKTEFLAYNFINIVTCSATGDVRFVISFYYFTSRHYNIFYNVL
jgi:hypothetical protein